MHRRVHLDDVGAVPTLAKIIRKIAKSSPNINTYNAVYFITNLKITIFCNNADFLVDSM